MPEFVLIAEFNVGNGHIEALLAAGRAESEAALRDEDGCRAFDILVDDENSRRGLFVEVYTDEDAYQKHRESAHYRAFFKAIQDLQIEWKKTRYWRL